MSKPSFPKSLLSAYFDGEVTAEERAAVSRAAQSSAAVQQTLDDFAQLSENIKSLREGVPSPQLREAVLAQIQSSTRRSRITSVPAMLQHRKLPIAAAAVTVMAAGLLIMFISAGSQPGRDAQIAANQPVDRANADMLSHQELPADPPGERLALRSAPRPAQSSQNGTAGDVAAATAASEMSAAESESARTTSIPEEWYTQQVVHDRLTPRPGDIMNYILREADRTVVIPVTVLDVQRTAGEFRVLLTRHGIQSLPVSETALGEPAGDSAVAILVESDWERFPAVLEELDTKGFGVATFVESSAAARRALIVQNSNAIEALSKATAARSSLTPNAPSPNADSVAARTGPANSPQDGPAASPHDAPSEIARSAAAAPSGMFLESPVTDEFLEELDERQQAGEDEVSAPAVAESTPSPEPAGRDANRNDGTSTPRFWERPYASQAPARVVFVIKKSGSSP